MTGSGTIDLGDLVAIDRATSLASHALDKWNQKKLADPSQAIDRDPWRNHRKIAGKVVLDAISARPAMAHETDFRAALRAHLTSLIIARVTFETDVTIAEKVNEPLGILDLGKLQKISWRQAMSGMIATRAPFEADAYLKALAECGPEVAAAAREHRARRDEAAKRLGESSVHAHSSPSIGFACAAARALLDATEDLATDTIRDALKRNESVRDRASPTDVIAIAVARDATSGWPSRLAARWLEELFGAHVRGLALEPIFPSLVVGASSFARALEAFGFSFGRAIAFKSRPFVLADDASASGAHRVGALFGALACGVPFHRRALGIGSEDAQRNARSLTRSALIEARLRAARLLLTETAPSSRGLFEEVTFRGFGASLPISLYGAWPLPRADEPARFLAALEAPELSQSFVERFDDDWFLNPRAFESLRHSLPRSRYESFPDRESTENSAVETARQFAHALESRLA
ncbi:MAG: hypothetical protein ABI183_14450 [Polyangiaceae bacterium]